MWKSKQKMPKNVWFYVNYQIFVCECAISGFQTPSFDRARQHGKSDPFLRQMCEKVSKKCLKMYDLEDSLLKLANFNFEAKKGPFCKEKSQK